MIFLITEGIDAWLHEWLITTEGRVITGGITTEAIDVTTPGKTKEERGAITGGTTTEIISAITGGTTTGWGWLVSIIPTSSQHF